MAIGLLTADPPEQHVAPGIPEHQARPAEEQPAATAAGAATLETLPDDALVALVAAGEVAALGLLYDRYGTAVFSLAQRITRDQGLAEELTQEVFLRLWRHAATYSPGRGRFVSWLLGIAHHQAIDHVRRQRVRPGVVTSREAAPLREEPDPRADVAETVWLRQLSVLLRLALARLPISQRYVIERAYFAGLTQREIAAELGIPLGTVKGRLRLGLQHLRAQLRELDESAGSRRGQ